ncbi:hypothetical protein [Erythrobacter rubeus]
MISRTPADASLTNSARTGAKILRSGGAVGAFVSDILRALF